MAEVQQNEKGGGGKNKQKKQLIRVDFTPMVDMNMLLITFFMFATTLMKPMTMNISMPIKEDNLTEEEKTKIKKSGAITLLLGAENELYYYLGAPDEATYSDSTYLVRSSYGATGVQQILLEKNTGTYEKIQALKIQLNDKQIPDSVFRRESRQIHNDAKEFAPNVMIKPTELSTYKNFVDALDEMLITNIGSYAVMELTTGDRYLLYQKTGNKDYLTDEQKAELAKK